MAAVGGLFAMSADAVRFVFRKPFQWREFLEQAWFVARVSLAPTLLVAIPFTVLVSFTLNILLRELGAADLSGAGAAFGAVTQVGPLVTVLIVAGAGATAMCADLGSRTIREEIDAMEVMGLSVIQRLVVPRMVAAVLVSVCLTGVICFVGFFSGYIFNVFVQNGTPGTFVTTFASFATVNDFILTMIKAAVFGAIVAIVACHKGLNTSGGPAGVANAVNATVVASIILLMLVNVGFTQLYVMLFPRTGF